MHISINILKKYMYLKSVKIVIDIDILFQIFKSEMPPHTDK